MALGSNFYPVYEQVSTQLENGIYTVRIVSAELKQFSNGNEYADVKVEVKDHPGCTPNRIQLYEAPVLGQTKFNGQPVTSDDVNRANGKITRFFQCFGISMGDFDFRNWKGKIGTVKCAEQYDGTEPDKKSKKYKELTPQVKPGTVAQSATSAAAKSTKVVPAATQQAPAADNGFPEDIPF